MKATGSMGWFLQLMAELDITCRVGHPAAIRRSETRRHKHDRRDAALLLDLHTHDRFPAIWMPTSDISDLRALLLHRHQWVRIRTRVMNALQAWRWHTAFVDAPDCGVAKAKQPLPHCCCHHMPRIAGRNSKRCTRS